MAAPAETAVDALRAYQVAVDNGDRDQADALWHHYLAVCEREMRTADGEQRQAA